MIVPGAAMIILIHLMCTLFMLGLIWFVQVVHYPLHGYVSTETFPAYQQHHVNWTGVVVGPAMIMEAVTMMLLLIDPPPGAPPTLLWLSAFLLLVIWASTALVHVPIHRSLQEQFDKKCVQKLVATNWIRIIAWTLRGVVILYVISLLLTDIVPR